MGFGDHPEGSGKHPKGSGGTALRTFCTFSAYCGPSEKKYRVLLVLLYLLKALEFSEKIGTFCVKLVLFGEFSEQKS